MNFFSLLSLIIFFFDIPDGAAIGITEPNTSNIGVDVDKSSFERTDGFAFSAKVKTTLNAKRNGPNEKTMQKDFESSDTKDEMMECRKNLYEKQMQVLTKQEELFDVQKKYYEYKLKKMQLTDVENNN